MARHDFESDTMTTHDIMHCTLVYKTPEPWPTVISIANGDTWTDYEVPTRPTGAHRQGSDFWNDPHSVILVKNRFDRYFECPRAWDDGMAVDFEYIRIPRV